MLLIRSKVQIIYTYFERIAERARQRPVSGSAAAIPFYVPIVHVIAIICLKSTQIVNYRSGNNSIGGLLTATQCRSEPKERARIAAADGPREEKAL